MATTSLPYHCPKCGGFKEFQNLLTLREHLTKDHTFSDFIDSSSPLGTGISGKWTLPDSKFNKTVTQPMQYSSPLLNKSETYVPNLLQKLSNVAEELKQQLLIAQSLNSRRSRYTNLHKQSIGIHQYDIGEYPQHNPPDVYTVTSRNSRRSFTPDDENSPVKGSVINGRIAESFNKDASFSATRFPLRKHQSVDEKDSLILSAALRKVQDELEVKEEELKSSKGELTNLTMEKLKLNENSVTLGNELEATKEKVSHLKTEIEDKKRLIQEKDRNLKELNEFLEKTSEQQATAKEKLKDFMDSVLNRAEQAENDLHTLHTSLRNTPVGSMTMQSSPTAGTPVNGLASFPINGSRIQSQSSTAGTPVNGLASFSMNGSHIRSRSPTAGTPVNGLASFPMNGSHIQPHSLSSSNDTQFTTRNQLNGTTEHRRRPMHGHQQLPGRLNTNGRRSAKGLRGSSQNSARSGSQASNSPVLYQRRDANFTHPNILEKRNQSNGDGIHQTVSNPSSNCYPSSPQSGLLHNQELHPHELHPHLKSEYSIGTPKYDSRIANSEFAISQMSPQRSNPLQYSKPEEVANGRRNQPTPKHHMLSKRNQRHALYEPVHETSTNEQYASPDERGPLSGGGGYERDRSDEDLPDHDMQRVQEVTTRTTNGMDEDFLDLEVFRNAVENVLHEREIQSRATQYSQSEGEPLYTTLQPSQQDSIISEGQSSGYDDSYGYDSLDDGLDELPVRDQSSGFKDCPKQRKIALFCVFSYLETEELLTCSQVCKEWCHVSHHPALWKKVYLSSHIITSKFLQTISKWCTQTEHLTLESLQPRTMRKGERRQDYLRKTRGSLEAGLEYILQASGSSLLTLRIFNCGNVLTDRSLWLASCHCRFLETIMYVSSTDPVGHEVIWALGAGCRNIRALQIPPLFPCENSQKFNNKCVQMIGRCWPLIQGLCIGGIDVDIRGLVSLVRNCPRLCVLELDHMQEMTEETAVGMCSNGLRGLETIIFTATPVTPKAIIQFNSACPQLKVIAVYVGISDYFDDIDNRQNQIEYKNIASRLKLLKKKPALMNILHLKTNCK
ncbi:uncharacterized protein [Antedon mediterranea]|uniref:uncharacterized protein n=1 Tax=Antedon mediterranea TaxID=105859 RepID=UPI003AF7BD49